MRKHIRKRLRLLAEKQRKYKTIFAFRRLWKLFKKGGGK